MCEMPGEYFTDEAFFKRNEYLLKPKERFPNANIGINGPYDIEYTECTATYEARKNFEDNFKKKIPQILEKCKTERAFKIQFNRWKRYLEEHPDINAKMINE